MSKVFVIGFSKTCTTSLAEALRILGYKTTGFSFEYLKRTSEGDLDWIKEVSDNYDAFHDWPYPLVYKEMYKLYPDAKFILTLRKNPIAWYKSMKLHSTLIMNKEMHQMSMGFSDTKNQKTCTDSYVRHIKEVSDFFDDKRSSFLTMRIDAGDSWGKLCSFLDKPLPGVEFPMLNVKTESLLGVFERKISDYRRRIKIGTKQYNEDRKNRKHIIDRVEVYKLKLSVLEKAVRNYKIQKRKLENEEGI